MSFPQPFDLTGRVALVTGGSKGLGRGMPRGLVGGGAAVVISGRHKPDLEAALPQVLGDTGRRGHVVVADMTRRDDVARLADEAVRRMGKVDILINNAGSNTPQPADAITDAAWDNIIELNLSSVMALTRALLPGMKGRKWGRVVHVSSIMAFMSREGRSAYSATKAALLGMARAAALELGPHGVTVNCIAPGPF